MDNSHLTWRKSTYSGGNGGNCIEVAATSQPLIAIRDSKDPNGATLAFTSSRWQSFLLKVSDNHSIRAEAYPDAAPPDESHFAFARSSTDRRARHAKLIGVNENSQGSNLC